MAAVEHQRCEIVRGGAGGGAASFRKAADFQYQGSTFTAEAFVGKLAATGVAISMDGRGRFMDNIFIERLWRSIKYEEVHLKAYADAREARAGQRHVAMKRSRFFSSTLVLRPQQPHRVMCASQRCGARGVFERRRDGVGC